MDIRELPLDDLVLDPDLNLRDRLDEATVERYAEAWGRLPPVMVYEVEGRWLLADGFHRHAAAASLGKRSITAEIRPGNYDDALEFAAGANLAHGLPFNRNERRRAVDVKLRLHPDWSDRRLAEELGVSRDLVGKIRKSLVEGGQIPSIAGRVGADGKTYPAQGLPKDPNEHLPRGPAIAQQDDPRDRGGRENDLAPWEDDGPPRGRMPDPGFDPGNAKAMALADPVAVATPTIDEMLGIMANQIGEVVAWTRADGFDDALDGASMGARNAFRLAVNELAMRAEELGV